MNYYFYLNFVEQALFDPVVHTHPNLIILLQYVLLSIQYAIWL
jgi:hypothetical protein